MEGTLTTRANADLWPERVRLKLLSFCGVKHWHGGPEHKVEAKK